MVSANCIIVITKRKEFTNATWQKKIRKLNIGMATF